MQQCQYVNIQLYTVVVCHYNCAFEEVLQEQTRLLCSLDPYVAVLVPSVGTFHRHALTVTA